MKNCAILFKAQPTIAIQNEQSPIGVNVIPSAVFGACEEETEDFLFFSQKTNGGKKVIWKLSNSDIHVGELVDDGDSE